jgi:hypothetical protein
VDIVALVSLATSVEAEASLLAPVLGSTVYETALLLRTPSPVPLLRTDDRTRALEVLGQMRARGHDVVACDAAAVISSEAMLHVRSFRIEPDGFVAIAADGGEQRVAWSDVVALVRAIHRRRSEQIEKSEERSFSLGRAALSGGVLVSKTVTKSKVQSVEEREQVLYVFRHGGVPLLVNQSRTQYQGLGTELRPVQIENFTTLVRLLRERANAAPYDERLLGPRPGLALDRVRVGAAGSHSSSSSDGIDLLAHIIALAVARAPRPYR